MTALRMDNVGIVVKDLDAVIDFFAEIGLWLEGRDSRSDSDSCFFVD